MKAPAGFTVPIFGKQRFFFVDAKGKDAGFDRWRVDLYFSRHYAQTHFLSSEAHYNDFLRESKPYCFKTYDDFCKAMPNN